MDFIHKKDRPLVMKTSPFRAHPQQHG
jgi:hypothetical protein